MPFFKLKTILHSLFYKYSANWKMKCLRDYPEISGAIGFEIYNLESKLNYFIS